MIVKNLYFRTEGSDKRYAKTDNPLVFEDRDFSESDDTKDDLRGS